MGYTQSYKFKHRSRLAISIAAALGMAGGFGNAALAQDADSLEEVVVTGSRIVRRDFESNSPIRTIDAAQFEEQSGLNIESYLNQLPDYSPANSPVTTQQEINATPVNTLGISSVSMRGFGPNRNLVLIDGKRMVPTNALMVTDINAIPSALIQRVETITGGASAVYGADAVGGVTNFILRKDFEGLELDTQYGTTDAGGGEEARVSGILGTDVFDGRGNITVGFEYYDRKEALEVDRSFYTDAWNDPTVEGELFFQGFNGFTVGFNRPNDATMDAIFADRPADTGFRGVGTGFIARYRFNPDGTLFPVVGDNISLTNGIVDGREWAAQNVLDGTTLDPNDVAQVIKWNTQDAIVSAPQNRWSFFTRSDFEITEDVMVFANATFARSNSGTRLNYGSTASFGWEATVPFNAATDSPVDPTLDYTDPAVVTAVLANPAAYANPGFIPSGTAGAQHPVVHELAVALLSRTDPAGGWIPEIFPRNSLENRASDNDNIVWQIETGINAALPFRDWTSELYYSHGEVDNSNVSTGFQSLERWRRLVNEPDYGRNAILQANSTGASPGFGTNPVECTSGFYETIFFSDTPPSEDCSKAIGAPLQNRLTSDQDIVEINFQGGLLDLPAGEVRAAAGYQWRKNQVTYTPDLLQSSRSFEDQVIGVYPVGDMDASTSVDDYYVEALVPVLGDVGVVQGLELELGARFSDYEDSDSQWTYKALANIEANDWLRLRGGYNRATRAPNVGEKYLGLQQVFLRGITNNFGDPCGLRSNAPFGAGGALPDPILAPGEPETQLASGQTAAGAQSTLLICQALMTDVGAGQFYANNPAAGSGGAANWVYQEGNPDVEAETADSWSAGFVASSPWSNPWLENLTLSFDWWKVDIEDAIQQYTPDYANYLCFGVTTVTNAAEAAAQAATTDCQNVPRSPTTGAQQRQLLRYANQATIKTEGIDIAANWRAEFGDLGIGLPGGLALSVQMTYIDSYRTKESLEDFDPEIEWVGSLGPTLTGTNPGAYDYRLFTSLTYFKDDWSVGLRWRHLPSVITADRAKQNALIANNAAAAAGAAGAVPLSYTPITDAGIGSYDIFDMSFNWTINEKLTLRGGITNLLDTSPEITGRETGYAPGTDLTSVCGGAPGCVNPTAPQLASSGAGITNPGYYDVLGRRFFLGMKARF
ncbi:MAG: TonB-dependent receptor domain-containing protein [Gammaproteobacteria bacterium]